MCAEGRPAKRWFLTRGVNLSANRGFLSCTGNLELDLAPCLCVELFQGMDARIGIINNIDRSGTVSTVPKSLDNIKSNLVSSGAEFTSYKQTV